jgi:hypothetical protein
MINFDSLTETTKESYYMKAEDMINNGLTSDTFIDIIALAKKLYVNDIRKQNENS